MYSAGRLPWLMLFWPHAKQPDVAAHGLLLLMRYLATTLLFAGVVAGLPGCGGGGGDVPSGAVAEVSGTTITQQQFDALLEQAKRSYKTQKRKFPSAGTPEYQTLKNQAVQYLVQRIEFKQEAEDLGIKISDSEIDA